MSPTQSDALTRLVILGIALIAALVCFFIWAYSLDKIQKLAEESDALRVAQRQEEKHKSEMKNFELEKPRRERRDQIWRIATDLDLTKPDSNEENELLLALDKFEPSHDEWCSPICSQVTGNWKTQRPRLLQRRVVAAAKIKKTSQ